MSISNLGYKTVLLIGLVQCLAMVPGVSRSGATIIGAMILGTSRIVATEFSFYLAIPTMVAASAYSLLKFHAVPNLQQFVVLSIRIFCSLFGYNFILYVFFIFILIL